MIDEELYQKATDELNSEHRRPHIWARACALANDDHDEARYLYTNLRVEELLSEAASGAADRPVAGAAPDQNLELEPILFDELPELGDGTVSSVAAGQGGAASPLPGALDDGTLRPASVHGRMTLDLDDDAALDLDPRDVRRLNEAARGAVSAIDGRDVPDGSDPDGVDAADDPDPVTEGAADADAPASPLADDPDDEPAGTAAGGAADEPADAPPDDVLGDVATDPEDDSAGEPAVVRDGLDELFANVMAGHARDDERSGESARLVTADPLGEGYDAVPLDEPDPADDSVVETIEADEIGIDDTIALDLDRRPTPDDAPHGLDDLDWLDEAYRTERRNLATPSREPPDLEDGSDALTRELRRQAEELPGSGRNAVIAHDPLDTLPTRRVGRDLDDGTGALPAPEPPETPTDGRDAATTDADGAADAPFALATDQPLELADERAGDTEYAVFAAPSPGGRPQTVRQGGSWGALVATLPWLLYRRLFGTAIVYALFAVAVLVGLAVTGLAWYDAGDAATFTTKATVIGFALIALVGLFVVPFRGANHWREDKLERRGFELVAYVRARRPDRAIELVRRASDRVA